MPYDTLPQRYRDLIPGKSGQSIFRNTLNAQMAAGKDEDVAFASAWAANRYLVGRSNRSGKSATPAGGPL